MMRRSFGLSILLLIILAGTALPQGSINPHGFKAARITKLKKQAREKANVKNFTEAINLVEQAMEIDPSCTACKEMRARYRYESKDFAGSMSDYMALIARNPNQPTYHHMIAYNKWSLGDLQGALLDINRAIQIAPKAHRYYYDRSLLFMRMNDANNARKAMTSGTLKEVPDQSVFIQYLLKRLEQNQEKYISSERLFASFREAVLNNSPNVPQYGTIQNTGDEGGDFIFIKK